MVRAVTDTAAGGGAADEDGVVKLAGLDPDKTYRLRIDPPSKSEGIASLEVEDFVPANATYTLPPTWTLTGKVLGVEDEPAQAHVWWRVTTLSSQWWSTVPTGKDGTFCIPSLRTSEVEILAMLPGEQPGGGSGVVVGRGSDPVVLRLPTPLEVKLENWPGGAAWGRLSLVRESTGQESRSIFLLGAEDTWRLTGLTKGESYTLRVMVSQTGLAAVRRGTRLEEGRVTVTLVPGATLRGRLVGHPKGSRSHVWASCHELFDSEDGTFELTGLAGGTWEISATAMRAKVWWRGDVEVPDQGTVDVELEPER
jgi:hypothetical protein